MAIKCLLRGILNSLPSMSRNISMGNTGIIEVGFTTRKAASSGGDSSSNCGSSVGEGLNGGDSCGGSKAATATAAGHGGISPGPLGEGTWHVLRVNDLSHLSYDLRS